jgi:hypothetical protein
VNAPRPCVIEGDTKNVAEAVQSWEDNWSRVGHLVADAKMLCNRFDDQEINFVGRQANFVAHHLAKLVGRMGIERQWLGEIPNCISKTIWGKQSVIPC